MLTAARKAALDRGMSVNQLVRDYLAQLGREADHHEQARLELTGLFNRSRYQIGERQWTREELYHRG